MDNYEDIINLPHKEPSSKHVRMSIYNRSAQFAPFSALTGYDEEVKEKEKEVISKIILSDDEKTILDDKLKECVGRKVTIRYFKETKSKNIGKYCDKAAIITKIDYIYKKLILKDKTFINIDDIVDIKYI